MHAFPLAMEVGQRMAAATDVPASGTCGSWFGVLAATKVEAIADVFAFCGAWLSVH